MPFVSTTCHAVHFSHTINYAIYFEGYYTIAQYALNQYLSPTQGQTLIQGIVARVSLRWLGEHSYPRYVQGTGMLTGAQSYQNTINHSKAHPPLSSFQSTRNGALFLHLNLGRASQDGASCRHSGKDPQLAMHCAQNSAEY